MVFNPADFGATPVTSTGFNPTQFGATPTSPAAKPDSFHSLALGRVVAPGTGSTPSFGAVLSNIGKLPGEISSMAEASPAAGLGKAVGNSIYSLGSAAGSALTGDLPAAEKTLAQGSKTTTSQFESGAGSAIQSAALPASMVLGGGTGSTFLARLSSAALKYGGIGAVLGGSGAMTNNASTGDVASAAVQGGLEGAAGGAAGQGVGEGIAAYNKPATDQEALQSIQDTISPKLTAKQTASAFNEGRVTRAPDTFMSKIFGQQPDTVAPSVAVQKAAQTIQGEIPGAADMNDAQLHTALSDQISTTGSTLRPQMEATPIKQATTGKVVDTWKAVKSAQQEEPEFDAFAGSAKAQAKFESFLKPLQWDITDASGKFQTPTPKTLADVWDARIGYDKSIPANVKNATEASAPQLQFQREMWMQNRAILNHAINDAASGLGKTSQDAFAKMTDMYTAQQNILSKAKINTVTSGKGLLGHVGNLFQGKKGDAMAGAAGAAGLYAADKAVKSVTGLGF